MVYQGLLRPKGWLFDGLADRWWFMYLKWSSTYLMVRNKPPQNSELKATIYYLLPLSIPLGDLHHRCILDIGSAPVILHGVDSSVSTGHGVSWGEGEGVVQQGYSVNQEESRVRRKCPAWEAGPPWSSVLRPPELDPSSVTWLEAQSKCRCEARRRAGHTQLRGALRLRRPRRR